LTILSSVLVRRTSWPRRPARGRAISTPGRRPNARSSHGTIRRERHDEADQVQRKLATDGLRGRKVPDLLIAAVAEAASLTVLHYDADFDHIASATGQPTQSIVERGSID